MQATILYGPRDIRFEERDAPTIMKPTDAMIRIAATCVCGSDLWPYRGINTVTAPTPMGHEYCSPWTAGLPHTDGAFALAKWPDKLSVDIICRSSRRRTA